MPTQKDVDQAKKNFESLDAGYAEMLRQGEALETSIRSDMDELTIREGEAEKQKQQRIWPPLEAPCSRTRKR